MKKFLTSILGVSLVVNASVAPVFAKDSNDEFDEFMQETFVEMMESDYTSLHFALRDYEAYGIEKPELTIGTIEWDDYADSVESSEDLLNELEDFDYDSLSDAQKVDYDTLHFYLETVIALNSYPYFDFNFSEASNVLDNINTTMTEFVFYEKEDIDDYLEVLKTVPDYVEQCLEITKKQAEAGYFLTSAMLSDTKDMIEKFVAKTDDNELIVTFDNKIDSFEGLTQEEIDKYKEDNKTIILESYIPSYSHALEELEKLAGSRKGDYSVYSLEDGPEYYAELAKYKTSLDMSVEDILEVCTDYLEGAMLEYITLMQTADDSIYDEEMDFEDADAVLEYLENHLDYFPEGPEVSYTATYLDPSIANDSIVAYYMQPPVDDIKDNVIKINGDNISDTNELYMTLAHEGFPGHLFQITYYLDSDPSLVRTQLSLMGYTEGWGMYAEMQALEVSTLSEDAIKFQQLNTGVGYVMDAAIDLGVNGLGWSVSEVEDYLDDLYLNADLAQDLYDFVTSRPGSILPYGVGLAMFENLEAYAKEELGKDFDQKEFNTVLLEGGDRPFALVQADVEKYVGNDVVEPEETEEPVTEPNTDRKTSTSSTNAGYIVIGGAVVLAGAIILIAVLRKRRS